MLGVADKVTAIGEETLWARRAGIVVGFVANVRQGLAEHVIVVGTVPRVIVVEGSLPDP